MPVQCQYPGTHKACASGGGGRTSRIGPGGGPLTAMPFGGVPTDGSMTQPAPNDIAASQKPATTTIALHRAMPCPVALWTTLVGSTVSSQPLSLLPYH